MNDYHIVTQVVIIIGNGCFNFYSITIQITNQLLFFPLFF